MRTRPTPSQTQMATGKTRARSETLAAARLSITNTFIVEHHTDNDNGQDDDDDYGIVVDRLNVTGSAGALTAQVRADAVYFFSEPTDAYESDVRPERMSLRYQGEHWTLLGGDFYRQLGRGIALSLRKIDEAALDISIQGGQVEYADNTHRAAVFAGRTNPVNLDDVTQRFVEDVDDIILGVEYALRPLDVLTITAWGVYLRPTEKLLDDQRHIGVGGLSVAIPTALDWLSIYVEGDVQYREVLEQEDIAYAVYSTLDFSFGDFALLLEGIILSEFEMQGSANSAIDTPFTYNQPPTLSRIDQEILNITDVSGGRVRGEYYFDEALVLLYANTTLRVGDPDGPAPVTSIHSYGGVEWSYDDGLSRLEVSGGYLDEFQSGDSFKDMIHAEVDWLQHLVDRLSLHLQVLHESRTLTGSSYERGSTLLGLEWARVGGLTFEFGYDTINPDVREFFYAGILTWQAQSWFELQVTGGTRRGGLRCIAGVCRNYPGFAGAQARIVSRW